MSGSGDGTDEAALTARYRRFTEKLTTAKLARKADPAPEPFPPLSDLLKRRLQPLLKLVRKALKWLKSLKGWWQKRTWGQLFVWSLAPALIVLLLVVRQTGVELTWAYWGEHTVGGNGTTNIKFDRSTIFRNFGLAALALIGLVLAVWRSVLAHQAHRLSERGLNIDRYQNGAQMLESTSEIVRLSGVNTLQELAQSDPKAYYIQVAELLIAFATQNSRSRKWAPNFSGSKYPSSEPLGDSSYAALFAITSMRKEFKNWQLTEKENGVRLRIRKANFSGCDLSNVNFSRMYIEDTRFIDTDLIRSEFSEAAVFRCVFNEAKFIQANISNAHFLRCKFSGADFYSANLSYVRFGLAKLDNVTFDDAEISRTVFSRRHVELDDLNFAWAWLDRRPVGFNYQDEQPWKKYYSGPKERVRRQYEASGKLGPPEGVEPVSWKPLPI